MTGKGFLHTHTHKHPMYQLGRGSLASRHSDGATSDVRIGTGMGVENKLYKATKHERVRSYSISLGQ